MTSLFINSFIQSFNRFFIPSINQSLDDQIKNLDVVESDENLLRIDFIGTQRVEEAPGETIAVAQSVTNLVDDVKEKPNPDYPPKSLADDEPHRHGA